MSDSHLELPAWMKNYVKSKEITTKPVKESKQKFVSSEVKKSKTADSIIFNQFWQIAEFSEKLLIRAEKEDFIVVGLDIDWPCTYKSVLGKTSEIHFCYGQNECCTWKIGDTKVFPRSLILLLKHPKVKLAGYNLSEDIAKLGRDFNLDVKSVFDKIKLVEVCPPAELYCSHNWDIDSAFEKFQVPELDQPPLPVNWKTDLFKFTGKLKYSDSFATCAAAAEELLELASDSCGGGDSKKELVLGFDLEWPYSRASGSGRVALVQICPSQHLCYLLHIPRLDTLPKTLVLLLNHKKVKLVGVNIANDIRKIGRDFHIETRNILENNIVELGYLANRVLNISERWSLARLVQRMLGKDLDKSIDVRCSNWARDDLTEKQLTYAASDAWAGLAVYNHLISLRRTQQ